MPKIQKDKVIDFNYDIEELYSSLKKTYSLSSEKIKILESTFCLRHHNAMSVHLELFPF